MFYNPSGNDIDHALAIGLRVLCGLNSTFTFSKGSPLSLRSLTYRCVLKDWSLDERPTTKSWSPFCVSSSVSDTT